MFAFLDGVESRRGGGISRNGNPIGKAWHYTQAGSGDVFPTGTHVNAPSLVSCLPARLIFEHASFDAYLPSPCALRSSASAREPRNIRLRFHRPQPRTFSNGKSKYPYLLTLHSTSSLFSVGKKKKKKKKRRSKGGVLIEQVLEGIAPFREWKGTDRSRFKIHPILFPEVAPVTTSYGC